MGSVEAPKPVNARSSLFRSFVAIVLAFAMWTASGAAFLIPEAEAALGFMDEAKIRYLIYPTLGNPAIVKSGSIFNLEFDPRDRDFSSGRLPSIKSIEVMVRSSSDPYPYRGKLVVDSFEPGYSKVWPDLQKSQLEDRRIFLVTVKVPESVPQDLFDLTVKAFTGDGKTITDSQPNSLQVITRFKERFSFVHLSDIHVFGPECWYPSCNYKERSGRPRYPGDSDPNRKGAVYYRKAISQINLMKPDFCVFTGDYIFGQDYFTKDQGQPWGTTTEYEYEMLWFYEETLKLEVPVFMVLGNHDGYYEGSSGAGEDWQENWKRLFGPLYYTFDYGDARFFALNSLDWEKSDRSLFDWLGIILQPKKYKGQLRGGGDSWQEGYSDERLAHINENAFDGQLAWLRDRLRESQDKGIRIVAMHHDPWKDNGSGSMWANDALGMGGGEGRLAVIKLMRDYKVSLVLSGHDHSDYVGSLKWSDGSGEVLFANTTSTSFQSDGDSSAYPGYRRIWINGGKVESYNYIDPKHSYPFYKDTNVGGTTNLGSLSTPAIEKTWDPGPPGNIKNVKCRIKNHLEKQLPGAYLEFPMPYLSGGYYYVVNNGRFGDVYDVGSGATLRRVHQVYTDVNGFSTKEIKLSSSSKPDMDTPVASMLINGGARSTSSRNVTLTLRAKDPTSGVKDMQVSNSPDFEGAKWEKYKSERNWTLLSGGAGTRKVYARFRDYAMPPNTSTVSASIVYLPPKKIGGPSRKWYFAEGCTRDGFEEWLTIQNPNDEDCDVEITYMLENGENIPRTVKVRAHSRYTVNVNEDVGAGRDVSTLVESELPVMAERPMYFNYCNLWDGGHVVVGAVQPATKWYFAEGCTREYVGSANFHTWFSILNPNDKKTEVKLTYMLSTGETASTSCVVGPRTRKTVCANWEIGPGKDFSALIESKLPVVCERPIYFEYGGKITGGHNVMGMLSPQREWYFAEGTTYQGFENYLCILNPKDVKAEIEISYYLLSGEVKTRKLIVSPFSRYTHHLNNDLEPGNDFSIKVSSDTQVLAERSMYFVYGNGWDGGHCVFGANSPRKEWFFAEGCTRSNFEEWLCVLNPGSEDANLTIEYMLENSEVKKQKVTVKGHARRTINVNEFISGEHDVSAKVTSNRQVIVERPMYFLYKGAWSGGHCVL